MNPLWERDESEPADSREFAGAGDDALFGALRQELRPPPLSATLVRRIESAWLAPRKAPASVRLGWLRPALAAAALASVFCMPTSIRSSGTAHDIVLSEEDAHLMLAAFAGGRWYGPCDAAIDRLMENVNELSTQLLPPADSGKADEWDLPRTSDESTAPGTSRATIRSRAVS